MLTIRRNRRACRGPDSQRAAHHWSCSSCETSVNYSARSKARSKPLQKDATHWQWCKLGPSFTEHFTSRLVSLKGQTGCSDAAQSKEGNEISGHMFCSQHNTWPRTQLRLDAWRHSYLLLTSCWSVQRRETQLLSCNSQASSSFFIVPRVISIPHNKQQNR